MRFLTVDRNSDSVFKLTNALLIVAFAAAVFYPIYLVAIAAVSTPREVMNGNVLFWPTGNNFSGFQRVFSDASILRSYVNTVFYTAVGTAINLVITLTSAFVLTRKDFLLRKPINLLIVCTMFFSGGMIPTFLVVRQLHMLDTIWSLVLPGAVSAWNLIVARTFFTTTIPAELHDAASIDGCSNFKFYVKVVLPTSSTVIAVIGLFYAVEHWNSYWSALLYMRSPEKYPLQLVLRDILLQSQISVQMLQGDVNDGNTMARMLEIAESVKYVVALVACLPIMLVFPFVDKYFVRGIMVGAIKG
ncbi:carbohydrate ABC transporter permease [Paenibacillus sp. MWE-103]|uniref:Carbohydrate ABC transporter permease n=1 Tax=Paenibacillus artemisiicola TaxID=1172618 RepID=A0ABS3WDG2_9BACL|nr:carbohydrate ABC transporter permease [Paenibacillus artemisiicola]MBO7746355.1 carbohydrate ABC transporter permease [Paenibacillus artemisiicola]